MRWLQEDMDAAKESESVPDWWRDRVSVTHTIDVLTAAASEFMKQEVPEPEAHDGVKIGERRHRKRHRYTTVLREAGLVFVVRTVSGRSVEEFA